jgi:hypothetical protein
MLRSYAEIASQYGLASHQVAILLLVAEQMPAVRKESSRQTKSLAHLLPKPRVCLPPPLPRKRPASNQRRCPSAPRPASRDRKAAAPILETDHVDQP